MAGTFVEREGLRLWTRADGAGDPAAPTVVFANSLGTDLRLWDALLPLLPAGLRLIRWDKRGHGRSSTPPGPYAMGQLVADAEAVCDHWQVRDACFVGLSVGGLIAQGLAVKRPDILRTLVLSNTAAKIGTRQSWDDRIRTVLTEGMGPLADPVMQRWFGRDFRSGPGLALWRDRFLASDPEGYAGVCAAIAGADFYATTAGLRLPTLGIAGSEDGSTPPDLVRETVDLIPGSRFLLIPRVGHLPCVEAPAAYAEALTGFLRATGTI